MIQKLTADQNESLQVAFCLPYLRKPESSDTSFLLQVLIAQGLAARGHHVRYIAPKDLDDVVSSVNLESLSVVPRTWSKAPWFSNTSKASWKIQQALGIPYLNVFSNYRFYDAYLRCLPGFDLVQERNGIYRGAVAMACKRLNLPYILFFDGDDLIEQDFMGKPLSGLLLQRAKGIIQNNFRCADRVICTSETAKVRLQTVWQVPEQKIEVFANGVDTRLYSPIPGAASIDRIALDYNDDPLIVFVGSFYPWQDTRLLLDAFAMVLQESPQAHLVMVGDGKNHQDAVDYARSLGIAWAVNFTGFLSQSQVARWVNAADIAVAPYVKMDPKLFIGSPMKLFEYMACAKPVIASDMGQISEIITDGINGLRVEAGNASALAAAILILIQDPDLRARMGEQARKDAIEKYSWDHYVLRLERLYRTVIQEVHQRQSTGNQKVKYAV